MKYLRRRLIIARYITFIRWIRNLSPAFLQTCLRGFGFYQDYFHDNSTCV